MLNIASLLESPARRHPGKEAVVLGETRLNYGQLNGAANQVANYLASAGIGPGDKVALSCPNLPYFPIVYYGILKAGAAVVPLNVLLKRREIAYHLDDSDAKAYFCFQGTPELPMAQEGHTAFSEAASCEQMVVITADPAGDSPIEGLPTLGQVMHDKPPAFETVQTDANDTAVILYTSGTTGKPKGAELSHTNMFCNAFVAKDLLAYTPDDKGLIVLPLFHSFGQTVLMNGLLLGGATMVLLPRFEQAAVFGLMQQEKISVFAGVPQMYWALMHYPGEEFDYPAIADQLRIAVSGGAALPLEVLKGFEERFSLPILEGYGLSETSPIASFNQLDAPRKPGSIGTPVWGVDMMIAGEDGTEMPAGEAGEVLIRGHNIMKGYYQRPEANAEVLRNGWFHSGDIGKQDEDGYFYIVDRIKDMIIRGGFNVYPREIEEVLVTHPEITQAAVIGVPHDKQGEEIKAFVVLKAGAELQAGDIEAWCKDNMAAYKYPRLVEIRESLPMNATGKVLKTELRK